MLKRRLLYIHNQNIQSVSSGGLNTTLLQVFSMCNAFVRAGYDVTLAIERDKDFDKNLELFINRSFKEAITFPVVHWKRRLNTRLLNRVLVKPQILQIIKKINPDLIFTREPYILDDIVKLNSSLIFESHSVKLHNRFNIIHRFLKNKIITAAKSPIFICLFSISMALSNYWQENGIPRSKLFSGHDGFDNLLFEEHLKKDKARENLNLPESKTIVTYTGGFYPDREIHNIIYLAKDFPELYFLLIGGPKKNSEYYKSLAQQNSVLNINFVGIIEHKLIPQYLFASDILLALWSSKVPTINFCSPLKLFEYMAAGRVILAHAFPTIKEVLTDNVDAVFCEPDNFDSMKQGLSKAIDAAESNDLGISARKKALSKYTWDIRVKNLMIFLNKSET